MKRKLTMFLALFFIGVGLAVAQTQVRGTVLDETGEPVIGATIQIKGTAQGTVSDMDGLFTLSAPAGGTLVISYVGMQTQEVPVSTNVRVVLVSDSELLQEVVIVGAMGIARPPRATGYGQSVVDPAEAIQKAEPDLFRSLDGKIPGVHVGASSATPGSATKVLIRGNSSFLGNNDPLYVVDGIPYSNNEVTTGGVAARLTNAGAYGTGISTLDPNDIESMNVLKGAAAAALYGSRAANGVILITTKAGSKRARPSQKGFEVTVNSSYTTETIASLPEYQNKYGQGSNFIYSPANGSWGPAFGSPGNETQPLYQPYVDAFPDWERRIPYQAYPNNVRDLFRTGGIWDNSVNIMSYNDKGNFSATVSGLSQDGYIPHSEFDRTSFSVGGNQKLDNGLTIGGTVSYSRSVQKGPFFGAGNYGGSVSSFARAMLIPRNVDIAGLPYETPDGRNLMPFGGVDNPLWSWKYNTITSVMDRTVSTINASYDFTDWLSASYNFGWNQYEMDRKQVINIGSVGPTNFEGLGQIKNDNYTTQEVESNFNLTFKHKFDDDLNLRFTVGHNVNQRTTHRALQTGNEMIAKGIYNVDNTLAQTAEESQSKRRLWALYADALLDYKNYAFLNLSLRNDHSSTLPVQHNSYYYPAATASLVFSDLFEINPDVLNFGKVRLAWGRVGNDASPYYVDGAFMPYTPFDGNPLLLLPTTYYDPELKPEFTTEFEVGTELQFFQGRAGIDFTWYNRSTTNQIAPLSVPASAGLRTYYTNFGELNNKGIELGLNFVPVTLSNSFKWNISGTFTKNVSKVISLTDDDRIEQITIPTGSSSEPQVTLRPGYSYGFLRGTVIARDDEGNRLVNPNSGAYLEALELGDLGDPYPDFRASLSNTFSYKGFSLGITFDARVGGILISGPASDLLGRGLTKDTEDRLGTRILPGVLANPNTREPLRDANGNKIQNTVQLSENDLWFSPADGNTFSINSVHEIQAFDATVFRFSEISLGYDLPSKWLRNTFLGSVNLSVVGRNLWYYAPGFPKYTNYDPGSNAFGSGNVQGIDRESAPSTRRIGFNARLTF